MPEVPPAAHAEILREIRGAQTDVAALQNATKVKTGYIGFVMVENTLSACHEAVNNTREKAEIITMLRRADGALALFGGGDVAPAVDRTRQRLGELLAELEPKGQS